MCYQHHGALQAVQPAHHWLRSTTGHYRSCSLPVASMGASGGDDSHCRNRRSNRKIDRNSSSINHKALETFPMATTRPSYTKLTCPSPTTTTGARGLPRFHNRRRGANVHTRRVRFVRSQLAKPNEKAHLVPFHTPTSSQPEGPTTSLLQSLFVQTTMEPLPHGLWSCSSKPLTGRTGHYRAEGRFSSTGTTGDTACTTGILPLPDKDSSLLR